MKRTAVPLRDHWQERCEEAGFAFHSMDGLYWREGFCYQFTADQVDAVEDASTELHALCLEAVERVVAENLFGRLGIPDACGELIRRSWHRRDRSLYGRFDLVWNGDGPPKLLEYNADTPTALFESSIVQWLWLEDLFPHQDQFNSIHEKLGEGFAAIQAELPPEALFHFTCVRDHQEDLTTVEYLRDVACQAGIDGRHLFVEEIGHDAATGRFVDLAGNPIERLFKLYPWEWLLAEDFGRHLLAEPFKTVIEPAWKIVLGSKGILGLLWEMFPNHPNLLPAQFTPPASGRFVRKPFFSREGANIAILDGGRVVAETEGGYGAEGYIYQQYQELPCFDGQYALIGSWIVDGRPAGMGIREDSSPVTKNSSTFVPHLFIP
ncbi:MAG: glutathionylspermidine synthase family protein [Thermodesulfobacteriota bacterium]